MAIGEAERAALEALGYVPGWLDAGILDPALLAEQAERLRTGGSRKTGRYRAQAVSAWLDRTGPLDDAQLDAFLALMRDDPDPKTAQAAVVQLIRSPRLSLDQLGRIASDRDLMRRHEALIRRTYLARRLEQEVTDELLQQVIEFRDAAIQTGLVRDARLSRRQAELLARSGANPTIRENAQAWCQDKKAWR